ncbi:E3 ubiquitin-protein ligase-like [Sebastes umbrosus]|uniref:E3 ubiquitin-protein ligase-like n=1 Tax=Sebastes umbrosus TaxID=72105 RepID=UPI00189DDB4D|nr:E3 ubiquitin-protein ligase-like [Sebastes umbrosus]
MCSEQECGICYRTYNAGRRCPRQLQCKHSFCESCLRALSRGPAEELRLEGDRLIICPLCRHTTSISGEEKVRAELRVDESILERLITSGVLDQEEEEDPEEDVLCDTAQEIPVTPAEESDFSPASRGGRVRRSWRKVCRLISGKSEQPRVGENYMTNEDLRSFAMMSCYMF